MKRPNKEQLRALLRVYNRGAMGGPGSEPMTYRQFRRTAQRSPHGRVDGAMVRNVAWH